MRWKIAVGYFLVVALVFLVLGAAFQGMVRGRLVREAMAGLTKQGRLMARSLAGIQLEDRSVRERLLLQRTFQLAGRLLEGEYIIINQNGRIVDSSRKDRFPPGSIIEGSRVFAGLVTGVLRSGKASTFNDREFVAAAIPISNGRKSKGVLVLYTGIRVVRAISRDVVALLIISFLWAIPVAVALSLILARWITKPLLVLKAKTKQLATIKFDGDVDLRTGDEIEDLAASFNEMARRLKAYHDAQKRFLQNASHELKTPLMSIQGYAEAIKDGVIDKQDMDNSLGIIIKESQRLKKLVEELIYLTKLETVDEIYSWQKVDLVQILEETREKLLPLATEKGIDVRSFTPENVVIEGDGEKLLRVFLNLLANGIRHGRHVVQVTVSEGPNLTITIEDDGPGFAEQDLDRVFERFHKGEKGETGLGLAIAKAIIEKHGGKITAANGPAGGGQVVVVLPAPSPR